MNIDWSKAPEGTTHFAQAIRGHEALWAKKNGKHWEYRKIGEGNYFWYEGIQPYLGEEFIERPPIQEWTGSGLPPVGTVCEFEVEIDDWRQCEVIAIKDEYAVCWIHLNKVLTTGGVSLRQIRTPEQIAAEERERAVEAMREFGIDAGDATIDLTCAALYDAGYRKFEITDE